MNRDNQKASSRFLKSVALMSLECEENVNLSALLRVITVAWLAFLANKMCYAQALGVVNVGSLLVELSGRIWIRNSRPSCRASQGQNHGVRHGYRGFGEVRQSA